MNAHQRRTNRRLWRRRNANHVFTTESVATIRWTELRPVYCLNGTITIDGERGVLNSFDTHPEGSSGSHLGVDDVYPLERNQYQWTFHRNELRPLPEGTVPPWKSSWHDRLAVWPRLQDEKADDGGPPK